MFPRYRSRSVFFFLCRPGVRADMTSSRSKPKAPTGPSGLPRSLPSLAARLVARLAPRPRSATARMRTRSSRVLRRRGSGSKVSRYEGGSFDVTSQMTVLFSLHQMDHDGLHGNLSACLTSTPPVSFSPPGIIWRGGAGSDLLEESEMDWVERKREKERQRATCIE